MLAFRANPSGFHSAAGFSMIEILVTIVILATGLLGWAGLQAKVQVMEMESYQRGQALALLRDMEDRLHAGRGMLADNGTNKGFVTLTGGANNTLLIGPGQTYYPANDAATCAAYQWGERQVCEWGMAIAGAAEKVGTNKVGAMVGARGCLIRINPPSEATALAEFYVVVVWQGLTPLADPDAGTYAANCASGTDFGTGLRRAAVTRVLVPKLAG